MKINLLDLAQRPAPIRLGCFILALLLLWLPVAAPIYLLVDDSNLESILTMVLLYVEFILLLRLWGKYVDQEPQILRHYGLEISRQNGVDWLRGLAIGLITVLIVFGLQGAFGWLVWQQPQVFLLKIVLEGLIVGFAVGFAEELLFRGWLLNELERNYNPNISLWIDAIVFAGLHFIKPLAAIIHTLPQFPALVLLGLTQVWGKRWRRGRLGLPIGLHGGLVWGYYIINIGRLIKYSGQVPDWVTGVNNNPLQGAMGVLFMTILALWMRGKTTNLLSPNSVNTR
ncbi:MULTISPECIES: CPBP family intramembrane glutamic endopeptidase [unclassified Tolypothrix]|uniref:CPBP family intramembrane glutamic endopeptidase n=1 Tax=unclassified Tolypothrix TaxID=2649714 RepID=UPI0005EAC4EB|nr:MULTISPECIES: type II CAAX endopeptidase family protein [unclassified Tolypothrix]BAY91800.1 abortive infection protein [Microchaete diplosiphon NIES-3275]EKF05053.1 U48 family peptidase [Tolypothrix sp. PCC 7601]MBE9087064.1 CPBP family intramembrane metalloprotease [Tolypothrix sp. LEGE 11397]UYD25811.1 CPBP family intramembrane metalloprotease [Tolypothrix sp. PCC 7712]UYD31949.1 CPBP family intramembrane metalloprotease [Tolypothrix sp. PCC 7601]